jgi:hypothetical protein
MATSNQSNQTTAAKSGINLTVDPVEKFVFAGLQERALEVFEAKSIWATSTDKTKLLQKLFGNTASGAAETKVTYPYMVFTLSTVAQSETRGSLKVHNMKGLQTAIRIDDDMKRVFRVKLTPVDFTVSVEFVTNNFQEVLRYANNWMFSRVNGWLRFNVQYGEAVLSIGTEMESTVSIPQRDSDLSNVQEYTVTSNLTLQGFMSFAVLQEQQIVDHVVATGVLGANGTTETWEF